MKNSVVLSVAVLAVCAVPTMAQSQSVTLRYKFAPGKVSHYKQTTDVSAALSGLPGGKPVQYKSHKEETLTATVQSVGADGTAVVVTHLDAQSVTSSVNGQPLPENAIDNAPRDLSTATLSPSGKVLSVSVPAPGAAPGVSVGMDFAKLSSVQGTMAFPDGAVKPGDTWSGAADLSRAFAAAGAQNLNVKVSMQSILGSIAGTMASVNQTVRGTLGGTVSPKTTDQTPDTAKLSGTLSGASTTTFDMDAGDIATQTGAYTLNLSVLTVKLSNPITTTAQISVKREPLPAKP